MLQVADPVFVGYCIEHNADVGGKALAKVSWDEKVCVCVGGRWWSGVHM